MSRSSRAESDSRAMERRENLDAGGRSQRGAKIQSEIGRDDWMAAEKRGPSLQCVVCTHGLEMKERKKSHLD